MKKIQTIEVEKTHCDFCDSEESKYNWMYKCAICERDICEKCTQYYNFPNGTYLMLCENCIEEDFTEYSKIKAEIEALEKELEKKRDQCEDILEKIRKSQKRTADNHD